MYCVWAVLPGRVRCTRCGQEIERTSGGIPRVECRAGLGDMVKSTLSAVGITEERVSRAIGRPCGCGRRAAAMNAFGAKYLGLPPGSQNGEDSKPDTTS